MREVLENEPPVFAIVLSQSPPYSSIEHFHCFVKLLHFTISGQVIHYVAPFFLQISAKLVVSKLSDVLEYFSDI